MGERFAPLPYRAYDCAEGDPECILALVELYRQAHQARWGWVETSERELARQHGGTRDRMRRLLADLERAGLAETETIWRGKRREGTRLRLLDPVSESASDVHHGATTEPPRRNHGDPDAARIVEAPATTAQPRRHHGPATSKSYDPMTHDPDPPQPPRAAGGQDGEERVEWVAELVASQLAVADDPEEAARRWAYPSSTDVDAVLSALRPSGRGRDRRPPLFAGAPDGLRRRDVAAGLRLGVARWRARLEGAPPAWQAADDHEPREQAWV